MVMIMLFRETSVASFAGLAIMLLLVPIQVRAVMHSTVQHGKRGTAATPYSNHAPLFLQIQFARWIGTIQLRAVKHTDERTRTVGELLRSVLLVKFNAWEQSFAEHVEVRRRR